MAYTLLMPSWYGKHTLLALCEGNPPVTGGFPSQMASNVELWSFFCCQPERAVAQTIDIKVMRPYNSCDITAMNVLKMPWTSNNSGEQKKKVTNKLNGTGASRALKFLRMISRILYFDPDPNKINRVKILQNINNEHPIVHPWVQHFDCLLWVHFFNLFIIIAIFVLQCYVVTDFNIMALSIWVRSRNCSCLVTWFCYQLIAKPGNKRATVPWPHPYQLVREKT